MTDAFAVRGVIEGFYGRPWTQVQRLELVDFLAARGMNTFVYGPKDDPMLRRDWRRPFGEDEHRDLDDPPGVHRRRDAAGHLRLTRADDPVRRPR